MASASSSRRSNPSVNPNYVRPPQSPESFESINHREQAATILQSYEWLSWFSFKRCESLVQTRIHFQNIVAGYTSDDEAALVDWEQDKTTQKTRDAHDKGPRLSEGAVVDAGVGGSGSGGIAKGKKRKSASGARR